MWLWGRVVVAEVRRVGDAHGEVDGRLLLHRRPSTGIDVRSWEGDVCALCVSVVVIMCLRCLPCTCTGVSLTGGFSREFCACVACLLRENEIDGEEDGRCCCKGDA
jgi:hypothetical protein